MNDYIIKKLTTFFARGLEDPSVDNIEILQDGITVLVLNVPKTILLIIIAALLGKLHAILLILLFYSIIRGFSKGIHAKTSLGCFTTGMINYLTILFISPLFELTHLIYTILFCICFIVYALYAPSITEARPVGKIQYRNLKIGSLTTIVVFSIIGNIYIQTLGNIILLSVISQLICILPITYKLSNQKEGGIYYHEETDGEN